MALRDFLTRLLAWLSGAHARLRRGRTSGRRLAIATGLLVGAIGLLAAGELSADDGVPAAKPSSASGATAAGRATRDPERWTSQFDVNRKRIEAVQQKLLTDVPREMATSSERLKQQLAAYKAKPTPEGQRQLAQTTIEMLKNISDAIEPALAEKEAVEQGLVKLEADIRKRAGEYRAEAEKFDQQLPKQEAELIRLKAENNQLKENYLKNPTDRSLAKTLQQRFHAEQLAERECVSLQRHRDLKQRAAQSFVVKAQTLERTTEVLGGVFSGVALLNRECTDSAKLLMEIATIQDELAAAGGGRELVVLLQDVDKLFDSTREFGVQLGVAWDEILPPEEPQPGGPSSVATDSKFEQWLDRRDGQLPSTRAASAKR